MRAVAVPVVSSSCSNRVFGAQRASAEPLVFFVFRFERFQYYTQITVMFFTGAGVGPNYLFFTLTERQFACCGPWQAVQGLFVRA